MPFRNNSLFEETRYRKDKGKLIGIASRPSDGELAGSQSSPGRKTPFMSFQYPNKQTADVDSPTSKWSFDEDEIPKPVVVAISTDLIEKINKLRQIEPLGLRQIK